MQITFSFSIKRFGRKIGLFTIVFRLVCLTFFQIQQEEILIKIGRKKLKNQGATKNQEINVRLNFETHYLKYFSYFYSIFRTEAIPKSRKLMSGNFFLWPGHKLSTSFAPALFIMYVLVNGQPCISVAFSLNDGLAIGFKNFSIAVKSNIKEGRRGRGRKRERG